MCKSLYGEEKKCVNRVPSSIRYIEYTKLNKQENKLCYFMQKYSTNTQERLFSPRQTPNSNLLLPSTSTLLNWRTKPCRFSSSWIPQYCAVCWTNQSCIKRPCTYMAGTLLHFSLTKQHECRFYSKRELSADYETAPKNEGIFNHTVLGVCSNQPKLELKYTEVWWWSSPL